MDLSERKPNRLKNYDYSQAGTYFITLCVQDRKAILSNIAPAAVGASSARPPKPELSAIGKIVETAIQDIPKRYPDIKVDNYVIMPNHVHILLCKDDSLGRAMLAPTNVSISRVVQQMKGAVTKTCGIAFWQKSYYDHIIRDGQDYLTKWEYIDNNPAKWFEDEFYSV